MAYLLKRTDQGGGYVAREGHPTSYVRNVAFARKFPTREAAERERCVENEVIVDLESILDQLRS